MQLLRKCRGYLVAFLASVLAVLSVLFFGRKSPHYELEEEEREKRLAEKETKNAEDRADRAEDAEELRKRILTGTLCVLFVLSAALASGAHARAAAVPAASGPAMSVQQPGPFVPGDYETLRKYYLATWDLSEKWRQLYQEAEASVTELRESNTRLLAMVEALRNRGLSYGLTGGLTWSPAGPGIYGGAIITF